MNELRQALKAYYSARYPHKAIARCFHIIIDAMPEDELEYTCNNLKELAT